MERYIEVERMDLLINLFGNFDENIRLIEKTYDIYGQETYAAHFGCQQNGEKAEYIWAIRNHYQSSYKS